jgi:hypothetical protein
LEKIVYNFGSKQGFYSEFNNLILTWIYCQQNDIVLELFEKNSIFTSLNSWSEFFDPYFHHRTEQFHHFYNPRDYFGEVSWKQVLKNLILSQKAIFLLKHRLIGRKLKKKYAFDYYTYELFSSARNRNLEHIIIELPKENFKGSLKSCFKHCVDRIYQFNKTTLKDINHLIKSLNIPTKYIGVHIRLGDKSTEANIFSVHEYLRKIKEVSTCKNIFLLTDDYKAIEELTKLEPTYNIYSFCETNEHGYVHSEFVSLEDSKKRLAMLRLFASMEILKKSDFFIGTYSSNPGMFLGAIMDSNKVHCLDFEEWRIW